MNEKNEKKLPLKVWKANHRKAWIGNGTCTLRGEGGIYACTKRGEGDIFNKRI